MRHCSTIFRIILLDVFAIRSFKLISPRANHFQHIGRSFPLNHEASLLSNVISLEDSKPMETNLPICMALAKGVPMLRLCQSISNENSIIKVDKPLNQSKSPSSRIKEISNGWLIEIPDCMKFIFSSFISLYFCVNIVHTLVYSTISEIQLLFTITLFLSWYLSLMASSAQSSRKETKLTLQTFHQCSSLISSSFHLRIISCRGLKCC